MMSAASPRARTAAIAGVLGVFACVYLFAGAGYGSIENSDDGITASVIAGMARGEHLGDLTFQGAVQHQRPLLFYWLAAAVVRVVGPNELGLRFVPVLATIACALIVWQLARALGAAPTGALLAAMLLLVLWLPVRTSRRVSEDALLAAFLAGAALAHLRGRWLIWGVLVGLAAMTKGVVAIVAPIAVGLHLVCFHRDVLRTRAPWLGLGCAVAIAAPWHLVQTLRLGADFWRDYLDVGVARVFRQTIPGSGGPLAYLFDLTRHDPVLLAVIVVGLVVLVIRRVDGAAALACWVAVPALLFSLAATRLPHYMLPAYPPLCALAGAGLARLASRPAVSVAMAVVFAAAGLWLRADDLFDPDYAPAVKTLALAAQKTLREDETLYVFDGYHTAAAFYSGRRTVLLTDSPLALEKLRSSRLLARSPDTVRAGTPADLARAAEQARDLCCLTPPDHAAAIAAALDSIKSARQRTTQVVPGPYTLLCVAP